MFSNIFFDVKTKIYLFIHVKYVEIQIKQSYRRSQAQTSLNENLIDSFYVWSWCISVVGDFMGKYCHSPMVNKFLRSVLLLAQTHACSGSK